MSTWKPDQTGLQVFEVNIFDIFYAVAVARSDAHPPGMRTVAGSIFTSGKTFFPWDLVMEKKSTTILSLPLIQEGQLSVTGERMGTKHW